MPNAGNSGPQGGNVYIALVGLILAGMAFFAAGGVAWRRGYEPAPTAPAPSPQPSSFTSARLPLRATRPRWDIASLASAKLPALAPRTRWDIASLAGPPQEPDQTDVGLVETLPPPAALAGRLPFEHFWRSWWRTSRNN